MVPGMPPNQMVPNRRQQNDYQYTYPPQALPTYYHPQPYYQQHPVHHQQWYQPQYAQPQYASPRQFHPYQPMPPQPQHVPLGVPTQPHMHPYGHQNMARPNVSTPPVPHAHVHSQMIQTPLQPTPTTPSVHSLPQQSPVPSVQSEVAATPPPSSPLVSRPSTAAEPTTPAAPEVDVGKTEAAMPPFQPPVPWLSVPDQPFPPPARRRRRKYKQVLSSALPLELPLRNAESVPQEADEVIEAGETTEGQTESQASTVAAPSDQETPATSQAPSEVGEQPVTPSSTVPPTATSSHTRTPTRPVVPVVPKVAVPTIRKVSGQSQPDAGIDTPKPAVDAASPPASETARSSDTIVDQTPAVEPDQTLTSPPKAAPKSWADLVRTKAAPSNTPSPSSTSNGVVTSDAVGASKTNTLAEAIRAFSADNGTKVSFLKPRGLINTGNMCYMNSVLQTLTFCIPFYDFIDMVGKRSSHSFKSDTPLLDSMILFLREFPVIDSASSVEQLRMRLKSEELEQFGDAFTPENVYDAIKRLPRFSSMRRGHQQDAEEFLIFFLEALHDECVKVINSIPISAIETGEPISPVSERSSVADAGWQEVGPKQKAAITHTSGHSYNDTPITKIFGGTLRSELRVPGKKNSVTFQPYQPLQLDIGAPEVHNIIDALKGLTRSETIHGDFNSPRGPDVAATKQIFIETLPPVLILHLKRFEYNNTGGTQKIWKKVGYPLELTIPKEVFPQQKRGQVAISGLPRYRLEGVIYHHGKNASSGHYTVDLRRQEGKEWIRLDDTVIRRLRAEDVAEGGAEEDPKTLAKALEQHKKETPNKNMFDQFGAVDDDDNQSEGGWNTAGPKEGGAKKWSSVANGTATPSSAGAKTPRKENVKDNKVAYILFYRRV